MMPKEIGMNGNRVMEKAPFVKTSRVRFTPIDAI